MSYCHFITHELHTVKPEIAKLNKTYHDLRYGYPIDQDNEIFGRLILEINQAGLSWTLMLRKEENFHQAFAGFDIAQVAAFTDEDRQRLLNDAGIVRNRLKINAVIANAQTILNLQQEYGSFKAWLDAHQALSHLEWTRLFKKTFRFTGGEIVKEFLMSCGYLPGAHCIDCACYKKVIQHKPAWLRNHPEALPSP